MKNTTEEKIDAPCVVCGGKGHSLYAVKAGHKVWKCGSCGTLFLFPLPNPSETEAIYVKEYFAGAREGFGYVDYDADKEAMRSVFERYLRDFERIMGKTGRLLDIGPHRMADARPRDQGQPRLRLGEQGLDQGLKGLAEPGLILRPGRDQGG